MQTLTVLTESWRRHAAEWIAWVRKPGHDSYLRFHRGVFLPLVPPPRRLTIDVGCGEGRVGRDLAALGHHVVGVDVSLTMANAAMHHPRCGGSVLNAEAAALPLASGAGDCVVAFMSLQDVEAFEAAIGELGRVLAPGGVLVMAITHPINTAGRFLPADADDDPRDRRFAIDGSYFQRRHLHDSVERDGLTMTFASEHRPLQDYVAALADAGFVIETLKEVAEPDPADKWNRIPLFLDLTARRQPTTT